MLLVLYWAKHEHIAQATGDLSVYRLTIDAALFSSQELCSWGGRESCLSNQVVLRNAGKWGPSSTFSLHHKCSNFPDVILNAGKLFRGLKCCKLLQPVLPHPGSGFHVVADSRCYRHKLFFQDFFPSNAKRSAASFPDVCCFDWTHLVGFAIHMLQQLQVFSSFRTLESHRRTEENFL